MAIKLSWASGSTRACLTSAGTATPTTLRLRLHSVGAHAASVRLKGELIYEVDGRWSE